MKYFSMFSGVGGFELGIHKSHPDWECIGFSEIDKYCDYILKYNYPNVRNYGNAKEINPEELPDFDMLVGGFPCQAFSVAGKRGGFEDTRGTLFFEIARILKIKEPSIVLLENVKGLLNHEKGETFKIILQALEELGYETQWMVLNSRFFGVPQNRERVFIIGHLRGDSRRKILSFEPNAGEIQKVFGEENEAVIVHNIHHGFNEKEPRIFDKGYTPTIRTPKGGGHIPSVAMNLQKRDINRPSIKKRIDAGLKPNAGSGTIAKENEAYCLDSGCNQGVARCLDSNMHKGITPEGYFDKKKRNIVAIRSYPRTGTKDIDGNRFQNIEIQKEDYSNSLTNVQKDNLCNDYDKLRRLTPVECERLQGFPDDWTKYGVDKDNNIIKISNTQRYKMMGNAVTVNVIEWITKEL